MGKAAESMLDQRFEGISRDPRFDTLPTKRRKMVIDERFKDVLKGDRFSIQSRLDMRGRPTKFGARNNLRDLYVMESDDEHAEVYEGGGKSCSSFKVDRNVDEFRASSSAVTCKENDEFALDLARGIGNHSSSDSDSDGDSIKSHSESEIDDHNWGELDKDAQSIDWVSKRLALCNMEWDHMCALDIYVLLNSFKPSGSASIISVTIYLSEFGKLRLAAEKKSGPQLCASNGSSSAAKDSENENSEAIRRYELERMRYYYAIVDCDYAETASAIYEACDGYEFETSALRMDLRFVPDNATFEGSHVKDQVLEGMVDTFKFKPKSFETRALSQSAAKLTWDESDPLRSKLIKEAFDSDADLDNIQNALIAPVSSDDEQNGIYENVESLLDGSKQCTEAKNMQDFEVTWDATEPAIDSTENCKNYKNGLTPWQLYLQRKKEKKKERKKMLNEMRKAKKMNSEDTSNVNETAKKKKTDKVVEVDELVNDERFSALYTNSAFAIDQTNPLFKSRKLVGKQIYSKQKPVAENKVDTDSQVYVSSIRKRLEQATKKRKI